MVLKNLNYSKQLDISSFGLERNGYAGSRMLLIYSLLTLYTKNLNLVHSKKENLSMRFKNLINVYDGIQCIIAKDRVIMYE